MRKFLILCFAFISLSLAAQESSENKAPSKHEIGVDFQRFDGGFWPSITYNRYRSERSVLHFKPSFAFASPVSNFGDIYKNSSWQVGLSFWNERRTYLGANDKWFLSHGLTANAGYSTLDYSYLGRPDLKWSGLTFGLGYKLGGGYKINDHFNLNVNVNPRINYQLYDGNLDLTNKFLLQAPVNVGLNYRF
jgi:hypothetical protein